MKKKICVVFSLVLACSLCFAQASKYRYAIITNDSVMIADRKEQFTGEQLDNLAYSGYQVYPLNTKEERFIGESGFRNIKSYFYSVPFVYVDYTKNPDNPDMTYIDSWDDVMAYVRGKK